MHATDYADFVFISFRSFDFPINIVLFSLRNLADHQFSQMNSSRDI